MRVILFSVFDKKANIYMAPFVARSEVDAHRQIRASFDQPQMRDTPIAQNPGDFALYVVGGFDDESGGISGDDRRFSAEISALMPPKMDMGTVSS